MATLLVMFAAMIGLVIVGQSVARLRDSAIDGDRAAASAGSELGVAEAVAYVEQGATASFTGHVDLPSVVVDYDATPLDADTWEIYSQGATGQATQARLATIQRDAAATTPELAVFADRSLTFHSGNPGTVTGGLGSNGQVTVGGTTTTDPVTLYQPDATCADCSNVVTVDGPRTTPNPVVPTSGTQSCPKEGKFGSTIDGQGGKPFLCMSGLEKVVFAGQTSLVNPPVIIHVGASVEVDLENSNVNETGSAADFYLLVHKPASWNPVVMKLDGSTVNGFLYAPGRSASVERFQGNGVFVFGQFTQVDPGVVSITYDAALAGVIDGVDPDGGGGGTWRISDWQKLAPRP